MLKSASGRSACAAVPRAPCRSGRPCGTRLKPGLLLLSCRGYTFGDGRGMGGEPAAARDRCPAARRGPASARPAPEPPDWAEAYCCGGGPPAPVAAGSSCGEGGRAVLAARRGVGRTARRTAGSARRGGLSSRPAAAPRAAGVVGALGRYGSEPGPSAHCPVPWRARPGRRRCRPRRSAARGRRSGSGRNARPAPFATGLREASRCRNGRERLGGARHHAARGLAGARPRRRSAPGRRPGSARPTGHWRGAAARSRATPPPAGR